MKQVKNLLNYDEFEKNYEINNDPSLTVPDQALSMREIINRYARGIPLSENRQLELFDEEDTLPDPRFMDLAEREAMAEQYQQELEEIKTRSKPVLDKPEDSPEKPEQP